MMRSEEKPTGIILKISSEKRLAVAPALPVRSAIAKGSAFAIRFPSTMKRMEVNRFG